MSLWDLKTSAFCYIYILHNGSIFFVEMELKFIGGKALMVQIQKAN